MEAYLKNYDEIFDSFSPSKKRPLAADAGLKNIELTWSTLKNLAGPDAFYVTRLCACAAPLEFNGNNLTLFDNIYYQRPGTVKKGVLLSSLTMIVHVFSGAILILVGSLVLKTSGAMTLENSGLVLERMSYALLAGLGLFLAVRTVMQLRSGRFHPHGDDCPDASDGKSRIITAVAVGIVPCPGAAMILLFSLTLGTLPAGLAAMVCIAAGMSITTAAFSLLTIALKGRFLVLAEGNRLLFGITSASFALGGAICITVFGSLLLTGSVLG